MQVFVLTDLEGVSGVLGRPDGIGNKIINTEVSNRLLTEEVNAAAEGLLAAGATQIICWDGHGGSNSILIERLHPEVQLYQTGGLMNPLLPVGRACAALVFIGAHAMSGVKDGFLHHTYNSHSVVNMWLNDERIGEIGVSCLIAACWDIPAILVSGDRAACREATALLGQVETVETKVGINRYSAINKHPAKVRAELTDAARRALAARDTFPVVRREPPYELKIECMCPNLADAYEKAGASRIDHVTVAFEGADFLDVWARRQGYAADTYRAKFGV